MESSQNHLIIHQMDGDTDSKQSSIVMDDDDLDALEQRIRQKYANIKIDEDDIEQTEAGNETKQNVGDKKTGFDLVEEQLQIELADSSVMTKDQRRREYHAKQLELNERRQRNWMCKRGKGHLLDFSDN